MMKNLSFLFFVSLFIQFIVMGPAHSTVITEEIKSKANTIAGGEIVEIQCHRKIDEVKDGKKVVTVNMLKAKLKVTSFDKGSLKPSLTLLFDDAIKEKSPKHYVGDKGIYYLSCIGDFCALAAENSVKYSARGEKKLPKCE